MHDEANDNRKKRSDLNAQFRDKVRQRGRGKRGGGQVLGGYDFAITITNEHDGINRRAMWISHRMEMKSDFFDNYCTDRCAVGTKIIITAD